jgi:hypothetical protein
MPAARPIAPLNSGRLGQEQYTKKRLEKFMHQNR